MVSQKCIAPVYVPSDAHSVCQKWDMEVIEVRQRWMKCVARWHRDKNDMMCPLSNSCLWMLAMISPLFCCYFFIRSCKSSFRATTKSIFIYNHKSFLHQWFDSTRFVMWPTCTISLRDSNEACRYLSLPSLLFFGDEGQNRKGGIQSDGRSNYDGDAEVGSSTGCDGEG